MKGIGRKARCLLAEVIIDNTGRVFLKNIHGDILRLGAAISPGQQDLAARLHLLNSLGGGKKHGGKESD